ncbi:hypothetical protein [Bradyrhizobium sp.]|jgi:hypothetical protein|uniref:hypothetical protein n=1 Tax=Bradyrhizobium sp. TaxID=376 RepID=UPI003C38A4CE
MALKARGAQAKIVRGRAEDDYASAGTADGTFAITVETGTTQQQMTAANDTVVRMANLGHQLMSKMVHVTLNKPWKGDPQETVVLTYGREEATPVGPDTYRDDGGESPVPASDRLFTQGAGAAPRWVPGKWVHYHLRFEKGPLGACACGQDPETEVGPEAVMPSPVARHWFGDWDVSAYELKAASMGITLEPWLTRPWHRDRVATENWGGYEKDFPAGIQQIYDRNGAINVRALRNFAPPQIPDVTVTRLDTMMRRLPNTAARVWDIFKWDDMCEKGPRMHFFNAKIQPATGPDIQQIVANAVAAALAAERAKSERPEKGKSA